MNDALTASLEGDLVRLVRHTSGFDRAYRTTEKMIKRMGYQESDSHKLDVCKLLFEDCWLSLEVLWDLLQCRCIESEFRFNILVASKYPNYKELLSSLGEASEYAPDIRFRYVEISDVVQEIQFGNLVRYGKDYPVKLHLLIRQVGGTSISYDRGRILDG